MHYRYVFLVPFLITITSCGFLSVDRIKQHYAVKPIHYKGGQPAYTATIEVATNHVKLQENISKNAFAKICKDHFSILKKTISEPFSKRTMQPQYIWHAASRQMIQIGQLTYKKHVRIDYIFSCKQ